MDPTTSAAGQLASWTFNGPSTMPEMNNALKNAFRMKIEKAAKIQKEQKEIIEKEKQTSQRSGLSPNQADPDVTYESRPPSHLSSDHSSLNKPEDSDSTVSSPSSSTNTEDDESDEKDEEEEEGECENKQTSEVKKFLRQMRLVQEFTDKSADERVEKVKAAHKL